MEILDLISKLENLATGGRKLPLGRGVVIDSGSLLELVDQMRLSVPRGVQEAQEVLDRREQIINQSMLDAKRIRSNAETELRSRLDENEVVKASKERAQQLIKEAESKGDQALERVESELHRRRDEADRYSFEVLQQLEEQVSALLGTIRRGVQAVDRRPPVFDQAVETEAEPASAPSTG